MLTYCRLRSFDSFYYRSINYLTRRFNTFLNYSPKNPIQKALRLLSEALYVIGAFVRAFLGKTNAEIRQSFLLCSRLKDLTVRLKTSNEITCMPR